MFRFSLFLSAPKVLALLCVFAVTAETTLAQSYVIRTVTRDKIRANRYNQQTKEVEVGTVMQGSFGAPSINDKGDVAYACVLAGEGITAFTSGSIVLVKARKKAKPQCALQAGNLVDNSFLPGHPEADVYSVPGSGYFFRTSRDVAIDNKRRIGFAADFVYTIGTVKRQDGKPTGVDYRDDERSVYGVVFPLGSAFQDVGIVTYLDYFPEILNRTLSINQSGGIPFPSTIRVTPTKVVPAVEHGTAFAAEVSYTDPAAIVWNAENPDDQIPTTVPGQWTSSIFTVATVESTVIGLPYFTLFSAFSEPIIAKKNRLFLVADISDEGDAFDGIWEGTNPDLNPVVVKNTTAPGGGTFTGFNGLIGASRSGNRVAFIGNLTDTSYTRGVFRIDRDGKGLIRIAADGDRAPGTTSTFTDFTLSASNNKGQVAFIGVVTDESGTDRSGIWLTDQNGANPMLLALEGGNLTVKKSQKRITKIAFNSISGLNRKGQTAFTVSFSDRTSAVVIATR